MRARCSQACRRRSPISVLMQLEDAPSERRELVGMGRKGGADRIVAAGAIFLDPSEGLLVAGIEAGRAPEREQDGQGMRDVSFIVEPARDPRHVVVADEGQRREVVEKAVVPVERPGQLEEIAIVERAPDRLPQLVLRDRVDAGFAHEAAVVAVNDLAEDIGVGVLLADPWQLHRPRNGAARRRPHRAASRRRRDPANGS